MAMLVCSLAAGWPAVLEAAELRCEAIGVARDNHARPGSFRVGDLIAQSGPSGEGIGLCGGTVEGLVWEVRADGFAQTSGYATDRLYLRQLYRRFPLAEDWAVTVGRGLRGWDVGYVAQPVDFLGQSKNIYDLEDRFSERKTSAYAALDHFVDDWTLTGTLGQYRLYDRSLPEAIFTAETDIDGTHLLLITQKTRYQPAGGGGAISSVIGQALELHASGFARQGTDRPIHLSLINDESRFFPAGDNPVAAWRLHDARWYPRWVVGGQWTDDSGLNLMAEWTHDASGLTKNQWTQLMALTDFHANGARFGVPAAGIAGNLKDDAATLGQNGSMQDYLLLRVDYPLIWLETELRSLINLQDGSTSWGLRLTHNLSDNMRAWLQFDCNLGGGRSEFAQVPLGHDGLLAVSVIF